MPLSQPDVRFLWRHEFLYNITCRWWKPTLVALIRKKIYVKIKQCQDFPICRTRYKSHFSLSYLYLKSQFNTHTHTHSYKHTPLRIFSSWRQRKARRESSRYCYNRQQQCNCYSILFLVFRKRNIMTNSCFLNTYEVIQPQPWQMLYIKMQFLVSP